MPMFGPQMPDVTPHVNVREGVQDDTMSRLVAAGWGVGKAAWQGSVQANLVGAEAHVDDVVDEDVYGTYRYDADGSPVALSFEDDLTRIANARKQGKITGDRAHALVNTRLRKAINDNPMFTEELTTRADRFFANVFGGGGSAGTGNIFAPTAQEQLAQKMHEKEIMSLHDEQLKWSQLGYTVEEGRMMERERHDNEMWEMRLKQGERMTAMHASRALAATRTNAELRINQTIQHFNTERGGLFTQEDRMLINQQIMVERNQMVNALNDLRHSMDGTEVDRLISSVDSWADGLTELVDARDFEAFAKATRERSQDMMDIQNMGLFPDLIAAYRISEKFGDDYLEFRQKPEFAKLRSNISSSMSYLIEEMGGNPEAQMFVEGPVSSALLINAMERYGLGHTRTPVPGPLADVQEEVDAAVAANYVAMGGAQDDETNQRLLANLRHNAMHNPGALNPLLTRRAQSWLNTDPTAFSEAEGILTNAVRGARTNMAEQGIDISMFTVREATDRERALAESPRGQGAGITGRHLGRTGLIIEPTPEASRQYAQSRAMRIHERGARSEEVPNINEIAKDLQSIINVAQMYPDMEIQGMPAMEYVQQNILGREPLPGIPWMRDEQIQDVEFNDQRIGGEEGSGVGGLEPADTMQVTETAEELANIPDTGPERLAAADPEHFVTVAADVAHWFESHYGTIPDRQGSEFRGDFQIGRAKQQELGLTDEQVRDPVQAKAAFERWTRDTAIPALERANIPTSPANIYLTWQQGQAGFRQIYNAAQAGEPASAPRQRNMDANPPPNSGRATGLTPEQWLRMWTDAIEARQRVSAQREQATSQLINALEALGSLS